MLNILCYGEVESLRAQLKVSCLLRSLTFAVVVATVASGSKSSVGGCSKRNSLFTVAGRISLFAITICSLAVASGGGVAGISFGSCWGGASVGMTLTSAWGESVVDMSFTMGVDASCSSFGSASIIAGAVCASAGCVWGSLCKTLAGVGMEGRLRGLTGRRDGLAGNPGMPAAVVLLFERMP